MNGRAFVIRKEFFFLFASMPALTGFFFTIFDLYVISVFLSKVLLGARLSVSYVFFLLLFFFSVVVSALLSPLTLESLIFCAQYFFLLLVLFSTWHLFKSDYFDPSRALYYWCLGIFPGFLVAVIQQLYPEAEIFNSNEMKSSPLPGFNLLRASGLFNSPNSFAAYAIICFSYFFFTKKYLMAAVSFFSALLTFSKTFFLIPFAILFLTASTMSVRRILIRFCIFVPVVCFFYDKIWFLFENRLLKANSLESRLSIMEHLASINMTYKELLFGLGPLSDQVENLGRVHNKLLGVFYQFGFFGISLFVCFLLYVMLIVIFEKINFEVKVFFIFVMFMLFFLAMISTFTFHSIDYVLVAIVVSMVRQMARKNKDEVKAMQRAG